MTVSVMITTKDRVSDLRRTCCALRKLKPPPLEVLITIDGSTENVVEAVNAELPQARVFVNQIGLGSVASRDRMLREARGDLVLALDDDSYPEQLDCIVRIAPLFEQRPKLAVLHFPQRTDEYPETLAPTYFGSEHLTRSFANSGAVLHRSIYLQLPGFESRFFHMYEEPDYALQCVAAGYDVLFSPMITIRHHYSGQARDETRTHHLHARNELWSTVMRCPFPFAVGIAAWRVFSQFRYACKRGCSWVVREPVWWGRALAGIPYCLRNRRPVSWAGYKRWLALP
ncbi:MAG: glycosyltransferase [Candidatus Udaeobacter sp.]